MNPDPSSISSQPAWTTGVFWLLDLASLAIAAYTFYSAPGEWPRTNFFLLALMLIFAVHRYGRRLGLDAIIFACWRSRSILGRIFLEATT